MREGRMLTGDTQAYKHCNLQNARRLYRPTAVVNLFCSSAIVKMLVPYEAKKKQKRFKKLLHSISVTVNTQNICNISAA